MLLEALLNNLMANTENAINKPTPEITNIVKYEQKNAKAE